MPIRMEILSLRLELLLAKLPHRDGDLKFGNWLIYEIRLDLLHALRVSRRC